jgi:hypothetical protein
MKEYENDRWRIISTKVGSGFSPAACKDKAAEMSGINIEEGNGESHLDTIDEATTGNDDFDPKNQPGSASTEATSSYP